MQPFLFIDDSRLLQTSLSKYFNKPLFSDITVIGPDGRKLLCHQVVLSAGSKRFANMLEQGALLNSNEVDTRAHSFGFVVLQSCSPSSHSSSIGHT